MDGRIRLIGLCVDCRTVRRDVPAVLPWTCSRCGNVYTITKVWQHGIDVRAVAMSGEDKDIVVTYERRPSRGEPFRPWGDRVELRFAGEESV